MKLYKVLIILVFVSCKKDELPVQSHDAGNVFTSNVEMGSNYKYVFYYDLETNTFVGKHEKTAWDIAFEPSINGFHIITNTGKAMFVFNTQTDNFDSVKDTTGFAIGKTWDYPSGDLDSTAIGNWKEVKPVYILDRGYTELGVHQGFIKIQFLNVTETTYSFKYANLDGSNFKNCTVSKNTVYNFQFFSFSSNEEILIEPEKEKWDICFRQYIHVFYDPITPYLVLGCVLNRYNTEAVVDNTVDFSQIDYSFVSKYTFSSAINSIGYDWKEYSSGIYTVIPSKNYVIKNRNGYFFKLHFIDFFNNSGVKGTPTWEVQKL